MSFPQSSTVRSPSAEVTTHVVKAVGGTAEVTKVTGPGLTVTRTGTGAYEVTFSSSAGNFLSATWGLQAATPSALAGHTVVFDEYVASTRKLPFVVYNASFAAHDLAASEWVCLIIAMSETNLDL